jgi:antitoxin (DNA-binding transcriptional repressor) of toxin-antitoxin stability system
MTYTFDIDENDKPLADLVERALDDAEVALTRGEQLVAKLVSIESRKPRQPGTARGLIELDEDFDAPLEDFSKSMR